MSITPAQLCRGMLDGLDASEGRRKRRSRNTTADSIGLEIQREMLTSAVHDEPDAAGLERWLQERCVAQGESDGAHRAMALMIWHEWQLAAQLEGGGTWLTTGARSDDREEARDAT